jgi:hypothetical protein
MEWMKCFAVLPLCYHQLPYTNIPLIALRAIITYTSIDVKNVAFNNSNTVNEDTQMDFLTRESKELFNYLLLESLWMFYVMVLSLSLLRLEEKSKILNLQRRKSFHLSIKIPSRIVNQNSFQLINWFSWDSSLLVGRKPPSTFEIDWFEAAACNCRSCNCL